MRKRIRQSSATRCRAVGERALDRERRSRRRRLAVSKTASTESPAMSTTRPWCASIDVAEHGARAVERGDGAALVASSSGANSRRRRRRGSSPAAAGCGARSTAACSRRGCRQRDGSPMARRRACRATRAFTNSVTRPMTLRIGRRGEAADYNAGSRRHRFQSAPTQSLPTPSPVCLRLALARRGQQADDLAESTHVFRYPRPGRALAARRSRSGLHHAHPDPGAGHSRRALRRRPAGRRPDRHRQDRRLRAAAAAPPDGQARRCATRAASCRSAR